MIPALEVTEASKIAILAADLLLATSNEQKGRSAADLRLACGDVKSYADYYIHRNVIGKKLANCFLQARLTGATLPEFIGIRGTLAQTPAQSLIAVLIKDGCIAFSLQQMSLVLVGIKFTSRDDVDRTRLELNVAFDEAEETAADEMAQDAYQKIVALHAATTTHLYETARPLPQMLNFEFAGPRPTLILSQRLYDTAARADELRKENHVVHPAFAPRAGRALAF